MYSTIRQVKSLNIFFGEESPKNKSFEVQQGDYNSNEVSALLYAPDEQGKETQINLLDVTATVVFKKKNGRPTPEYSVEIDGSETGRVRFCIPQKILKTPGDAMLQLKLYGDDSLLNSVIVPFEVIPSITDCGHADGCKPVTLTILQKVEAALEDLDMMREEFEAAEAERNDQFEAWEETLSNVQAGAKAVVNKPTRYDFPSVGDANVIYKAESERKLYQWNDTEQRYDPLLCEAEVETIEQIDLIHGGDANGTA